MAASWKGSISFGLVNIPVELHVAVSENRPHFRLLHAKDKSPVSYERVCQRENKPVEWKDLVKGYEHSKGKFVVLTKEDLKGVAVQRSQTVEILDFVKHEQIDDRFFDTPYYAVPGKGGERGYAVLREAIRKSGRLGIGKIVMRDREHLAALGVVDDALVLTLMRFANELVDADRFKFPGQRDVRPKELQMATMLVDSLADDWKPEKYKDDYQANLMRVIKAKLRGEELEVEAEPKPPKGEVVDLMERLRQSLEARGKGAARAHGTRRKRRAA